MAAARRWLPGRVAQHHRDPRADRLGLGILDAGFVHGRSGAAWSQAIAAIALDIRGSGGAAQADGRAIPSELLACQTLHGLSVGIAQRRVRRASTGRLGRAGGRVGVEIALIAWRAQTTEPAWIALVEVAVVGGARERRPCGAGAGYLGVSASGELAACHRFVEDKQGYFGNLEEGIDPGKQRAWLTERHVHRQEPCKSCWARYLCGGGCHHEVIHRGRPACDYIRGWLHYALQAYVRIFENCPEYFSSR